MRILKVITLSHIKIMNLLCYIDIPFLDPL